MGPTMALVHAWSGSQSQTHGSSMNIADPLPCISGHTADDVPTTGVRQTGKSLFLLCVPVDTRQTLCHVLVMWAHGRQSLPSLSLPCPLCRVCVHGRLSTMSKSSSSVSTAHTADPRILVVSLLSQLSCVLRLVKITFYKV
jgi:hypothetical protein